MTARVATWDVLAVGENSVDLVYRLPFPPQVQGPLAKMRIDRHFVSCGGRAPTMLATVAALGLRGKYAGVVGNDGNGERMRAELVRLGLDIEHTLLREAANRYAVILVDESSGERMVLWDWDASLTMQREEYPLALVASA